MARNKQNVLILEVLLPSDWNRLDESHRVPCIVRFQDPRRFHAHFPADTRVKVHRHTLGLSRVLYDSSPFTPGAPSTVELRSNWNDNIIKYKFRVARLTFFSNKG